MRGGSIDRERAVIAVSPVRSSPDPAVMTLTPPAMCRMAIRSSSGKLSLVSSIKQLDKPISKAPTRDPDLMTTGALQISKPDATKNDGCILVVIG